MVIQRLKVYNYGVLHKVDITFPLGTIGIIGNHVDSGKSNGSGKSTLLNVLPWVVTGKIVGGGTLKDIVGNMDSSVSAEGWIQTSSDLLHITRGYSKDGGSVSLEVNGVPFTEGSDETNKRIIELIGCSFDMLMATAFFQQMEHDTFTNSKKSGPTKRKEYIRKIRGVEVFDKCYSQVGERTKPHQEKITSIQAQIQAYDSQIEEVSEKYENIDTYALHYQEEYDTRTADFKSLTTQKERYIAENALSTELAQQINELDSKIEIYNKQTTESNTEIVTATANKTKNETSVTNHNNSIKELELKLETESEVITELIEKNKTKDSSITYQNEKLNSIKIDVIDPAFGDKLQKEHTQASINVSAKKSEIEVIELNIAEIEKFEVDVTCDKCFSVITPEHKQQHVAERKNKIPGLKTELINLEKELEKCEKAVSKIKKQADDNRTKEKEKQTILTKITEIQKDQQATNVLISEKLAFINSADDTKKTINEAIKSCNQVIEQALTTIKDKKEKIKQNDDEVALLESEKQMKQSQIKSDFNDVIKELEDKLEEASKKVETALQAINTATKDKETIKDLKTKKSKLTQSIAETVKILEAYSKIEYIFSKNGISNSFVEETVLKLQELTNKYLWQIDPGKSVVFKTKSKTEKETLEIYIMDNTASGGVRLYERYSGGEKTVINLCIRLALSRLLNERATKKIGFLVLDEVFGALDEINSNLVNQILSQVRSSFNQIFIISHTDMKDQFENLIRVNRYKDYSEVELVR
jgi:exonuclease SbcC